MKPTNVSTKQKRIAELARINPKMSFTSLNHLLDEEWLEEAYRRTRKDGARGIDGQSATDYEANLQENLRGLLGRIKSGRYVAPPVRRVSIPKANGETRPLGIPTFEDKVAQRAIVMLLEPIYEESFEDCSYGFRPSKSAHMALRSLRSSIMDRNGRWVLDADIKGYFDTIEHGHLRRFLDQRVVDGVVRCMLDKWLKAGVLSDGRVTRSSSGTPQGGVISPLLANIYLHYVLDVWYRDEVAPRMKKRSTLVRYCDDFVMAFEDFLDCRRVLAVLGKRLSRFGLTLHPDKTRMVDFRFKRPNGQQHRLTQGTTFDFLGFTHVWGLSLRKKNVVYQVISKKTFAKGLKAIKDWCRRCRHWSLEGQQRRLSSMLRGHFAYFGITGNTKRLRWYSYQAERIWRKWLMRRSRGRGLRMQLYGQLLRRYPLPKPLIVHRYAVASEPVT